MSLQSEKNPELTLSTAMTPILTRVSNARYAYVVSVDNEAPTIKSNTHVITGAVSNYWKEKSKTGTTIKKFDKEHIYVPGLNISGNFQDVGNYIIGNLAEILPTGVSAENIVNEYSLNISNSVTPTSMNILVPSANGFEIQKGVNSIEVYEHEKSQHESTKNTKSTNRVPLTETIKQMEKFLAALGVASTSSSSSTSTSSKKSSKKSSSPSETWTSLPDDKYLNVGIYNHEKKNGTRTNSKVPAKSIPIEGHGQAYFTLGKKDGAIHWAVDALGMDHTTATDLINRSINNGPAGSSKVKAAPKFAIPVVNLAPPTQAGALFQPPSQAGSPKSGQFAPPQFVNSQGGSPPQFGGGVAFVPPSTKVGGSPKLYTLPGKDNQVSSPGGTKSSFQSSFYPLTPSGNRYFNDNGTKAVFSPTQFNQFNK